MPLEIPLTTYRHIEKIIEAHQEAEAHGGEGNDNSRLAWVKGHISRLELSILEQKHEETELSLVNLCAETLVWLTRKYPRDSMYSKAKDHFTLDPVEEIKREGLEQHEASLMYDNGFVHYKPPSYYGRTTMACKRSEDDVKLFSDVVPKVTCPQCLQDIAYQYMEEII